jgi:hypothetical protein
MIVRNKPTLPSKSTAKDRAFVRSLLERLRRGLDMRTAKVRRLRQSVREQTYENRLKLNVAADRLAEELGS